MSRDLVDSGIKWIGKIPSDWKIAKLKYMYDNTIAGEVIDKSYWNDGNELLYTCQQTPMKSNFDNFPDRKRTGDRDLLLTRNATPYIFIPEKNSIYSNVVQKITVKNNNKKEFIRYALICGVNNITVNGDTIPSWNMSVWNNIEIPLISLEEQTKIANYLNKKCKKIDEVIEDNNKEIELLEDYKKNIVEKMLNNYDYKMIKIKYLLNKLNIKTGPFGSALTGKTIDYSDFCVYSQANLISNDFSSTKNYISEETYHSLSSYYAQPNDILLSMMGTIGKCKIIPDNIKKGIIDSHIIKIELDENKILPEYFETIYDKDNSNIVYNQLLYESKGSIMDGLNTTIVKNLKIPVIDINKQKEFLFLLNKQKDRINQIINYRKQIIEKLEEYKKSLIYECVTGKREV